MVPALQDGGLVVSDEEKEKTAPTSLKAAPSKPPPSLQAAPSDSSAPGLSNSAPSDSAAPGLSNSADSSAGGASKPQDRGGLGPQDPVMLLGKWFSKFVGVCCFFLKVCDVSWGFCFLGA